jgi:hypothetical protein
MAFRVNMGKLFSIVYIERLLTDNEDENEIETENERDLTHERCYELNNVV